MTNQMLLTKNTLLDVAQKEKKRQLFAVIFLLIVAAIGLGGFLYTFSRSTIVSIILLVLCVACVLASIRQMRNYQKNNTLAILRAGQFAVRELSVLYKEEGRAGDVPYFEFWFSGDLKSFVTKKEYLATEIGEKHYVVLVGANNRVLRSFAVKQYRLADELLDNFSQPQPEETDLIENGSTSV